MNIGYIFIEHETHCTAYGLVQIAGDWQLLLSPQRFEHATVAYLLNDLTRNHWDLECIGGVWVCIPDLDIGESAFDLYKGFEATIQQSIAMRALN